MKPKLLIGMIGERISIDRKHLGLTQAQLAKLAGVSIRTVGKIESGSAEELTLSAALKVLSVFGMTLRLATDDPIIKEYQPPKNLSTPFSLRKKS